MSVSAISRLVFALFLASYLFPAAAQDKPARDGVSVEDLKVRSGAGDKTATRQLAEMYYAGRGGVGQDLGEAARWYERLAKQGDARAQTSLGLMYARGYGVEKNLQAAHRWWSFAAAQNDPGAQYNLGLSFSNGEGVAQDFGRAADWYTKAAVRGNVHAQRNLGLFYHEGKGVARDPVSAYYWIRIAALQGDDVAQDALKIVGKSMSADQIRQAESQADEWMKKYKKIVGK